MVKENWILLNFVYVYNFENLFNIQKKNNKIMLHCLYTKDHYLMYNFEEEEEGKLNHAPTENDESVIIYSCFADFLFKHNNDFRCWRSKSFFFFSWKKKLPCHTHIHTHTWIASNISMLKQYIWETLHHHMRVLSASIINAIHSHRYSYSYVRWCFFPTLSTSNNGSIKYFQATTTKTERKTVFELCTSKWK